jgi:hypothetical protein
MLDDAYDDSLSAGVTLREQLRTKERAAGALISGGSLASVSKNSASQSSAFGRGNVTTAEIARGWRVLIDCYDTTANALASTDDAAIKSEMMLRLQPVNEFTKDFTTLGVES